MTAPTLKLPEGGAAEIPLTNAFPVQVVGSEVPDIGLTHDPQSPQDVKYALLE